MIYKIVSVLAWDIINIYEIVSTKTELTLILNKKDFPEAYEVLGELVENNAGKEI